MFMKNSEVQLKCESSEKYIDLKWNKKRTINRNSTTEQLNIYIFLKNLSTTKQNMFSIFSINFHLFLFC